MTASLLAACGRGDGGTPPATLSVSVSPGALTVQAGASGSVTVTAARGNLSGTVSIAAEGLPTGVTASITPPTLTGSVSSATVTVQAALTSVPGTYPITVRASASGVAAATATYSLTITPPPDFTLTAAPAAVTVSSAAPGNSTLTIARTGGFSGAVTLTAQSAQAGLSGVFTPPSVTGTSSALVVSATSAVPPGTYTLNVTGNGAGVGDRSAVVNVTVVAPPDFSLSVSPASLSIVQGASQGSTVTIARTGGFAGAVALALTSSQSGITGTFAPSSVSGTSSALSVAVSASVPAGTYAATITGTAAGQDSRTATLSITVVDAPRITMTLAPTSLAVNAGASANTTVTLTRTNFVGPVELSTVGVPPGIMVAFAPATVTGTTSVVTVAVLSSVPSGAYTFSIAAAGTGVSAIASTLTVVVTNTSSEVEYRFCTTGSGSTDGAFGVPLWVAFQSENGPWTRVTPTVSGAFTVFRFTVTGPVGAVAFVNPVMSAVRAPFASLTEHTRTAAALSAPTVTARSTGQSFVDYATTIRYGTRDELVALGAAGNCAPVTRRHTGTVAGVPPGSFARVVVGDGTSSTSSTASNYALDVSLPGPQSLLAQRTTLNVADRLVLFRDLPPTVAALPLVDFLGAESFPTLNRTLTILNGDNDNLSAFASLVTQPGLLSNTIFSGNASASPTRALRMVPLDRRIAGEVDEITASGTRTLAVAAVANDMETRTVQVVPTTAGADATITLGARLATPTITAVNGVSAPRARLNGVLPADYGHTTSINVSRDGVGFTMRFSAAYRAAVGMGNSYEFTFPDLVAVPGFIVSALVPRGQVLIITQSDGFSGASSPLAFTPGRVYRSVFRFQDASW